MKFSCGGCGSQYMISDDKVGPNGVRVRCKKCGNVVSVKRSPAAAPEIAPAAAPAPAEAAPAAPASEQAAALRAPLGGETTLERELGSAFETAFGGASVGLAAEAAAAAAAAPGPAPEEPARAADAVAAETISDWYVAVNDEQVGPLPAAAVKARWEAGEVGPDTLAWRPGMADWVVLSSIPEMAQYLAPVPRSAPKAPLRPVAVEATDGAPSPAPGAPPAAAAPAAGMPNAAVVLAAPTAPAPHANGVNGAAFKPSAASALAALASEEISSLSRPEPKPAAGKGPSTLVDRMELPDGGVDPTNLMPLPIKGLDPTGESALKPKPSAPEPAPPRAAAGRGGRSVLAVGIALFVLFAGALGVALYVMKSSQQAPGAVAAAPAPASAAPAPAPAPAPPAVAAAPPAAAGPNASAAPAPAPAAAQPVASAPPPTSGAREPEVAALPQSAAAAPAAAGPAPEPATPAPAAAAAAAAVAKPPRAHPAPPKKPKHEAVAKQETAPLPRKAPPERVAQAERAPEPPPAPAARKPAGDPLLDVGDDELERELSSSKPKRSVYVPPAPGADLPENVSVSQINEAVMGQKSALLRCIEQQKAADPEAKGTLKMRWLISGDGSVRDVRVLSDEFSRQPISPCITGVVKSLRFPRSRTTGQEVVFPFKF
jgi:predicted Zn finger-like uncharacterized protein